MAGPGSRGMRGIRRRPSISFSARRGTMRSCSGMAASSGLTCFRFSLRLTERSSTWASTAAVLRPNIVVGGVEGLEERTWPGRRLRIGDAVIAVAQLRGRCVMTTYDPDTLKQDLNVLRSIVSELGGTMALDCAVESGGLVRVGDPVG